MINPSYLSPYALEMVTDSENGELKQRLELYQVFSKLYDHHRSLLDEILDLEHSSTKLQGRLGLFQYVQGIISEQEVYLITNFLKGHSQVLKHPQRIWTIGRDVRQVAISIRDQRLSRCHAAIQYVEDGGFYLLDRGSTNGSFVNGERVQNRAALKDGDRIRLGSLSFAFFVCDMTHAPGSSSTEVSSRLTEGTASNETLCFLRQGLPHN